MKKKERRQHFLILPLHMILIFIFRRQTNLPKQKRIKSDTHIYRKKDILNKNRILFYSEIEIKPK